MESRVVAKAVLANPIGEVLLLRRSETDTRRPGEFDLPGGVVEPDENYPDACIREIKEEVGIELSVRDLQLAWAETAAMDFDGGPANVSWLYYLGRLTGATEVILSSEHDKYFWFPPQVALSVSRYDRQQRVMQHIVVNNLITL